MLSVEIAIPLGNPFCPSSDACLLSCHNTYYIALSSPFQPPGHFGFDKEWTISVSFVTRYPVPSTLSWHTVERNKYLLSEQNGIPKLCVAPPSPPEPPLWSTGLLRGADWSRIKEDGGPQQSNAHYIPGPQNSGSQNQDLVLWDKSSRGRGKSAPQHWMGPDISIKEQVFTDVTGQEVRSKSLDYQ